MRPGSPAEKSTTRRRADTRIAFGHIGTTRVAVITVPFGLPDHLAKLLTEAEQAIAEALIGGATYASIAAARGSSERTVANQARAAFRKLGVSSRFELARAAGIHGPR
jgi:DNA-binding NarL/FixJ family response regulator